MRLGNFNIEFLARSILVTTIICFLAEKRNRHLRWVVFASAVELGAKSLKNDIDSLNDNNANATDDKIQISFDSTYDVEDDIDEDNDSDGVDPRNKIGSKFPR